MAAWQTENTRNGSETTRWRATSMLGWCSFAARTSVRLEGTTMTSERDGMKMRRDRRD